MPWDTANQGILPATEQDLRDVVQGLGSVGAQGQLQPHSAPFSLSPRELLQDQGRMNTGFKGPPEPWG